MGMTISQKILASHSGSNNIQSGDIVSIKADVILANDISGPLAISALEKAGVVTIRAADKIVLVPDHFTPNRDVQTAEQCRVLREFSERVGIKKYFEVGRAGIEHAFLPEAGLVAPGNLVIGGDSHTCTYGGLGAFAIGVGSTDLAAVMVTGETWIKVPTTIKLRYVGVLGEWLSGKDLILYTLKKIGIDGALGKTMELCGEVIRSLDVEGRLTMANMAVEAGAINGIVEPDSAISALYGDKKRDEGVYLRSDPDALYEEEVEIAVTGLEPQVAVPFSPGNVVSVQEAAGVRIDQVFIGSCTNGRITDLRVAAKILKGKKAAPHVRLLIGPATQKVYQLALAEGLMKVFTDAEAVILPPSCGACFGGHLGILGKSEVCVSTTNRNFRGRMGHGESRVYLSNPAVAAASAVKGEIVHPSALG